MNVSRCGGILLHPTSLPSPYGIGDFGQDSYQFAQELHEAGQTIWQMLPLSPPGMGESPYQAYSAFAGNPLLISPGLLAQEGYLSKQDLAGAPRFSVDSVAFDRVIKWKLGILQRAYESFRDHSSHEHRHAFEQFCEKQDLWLEDYALFMALKDAHGKRKPWTSWSKDLIKRKPAALASWAEKLKDEVECQKFWQFKFFQQWQELREHCKKLKLLVMGDIPIYVSHESSEVWAHPEKFELDDHGQPELVAGVPPDYFSETGQLWGNPIYRWSEMERCGFGWWKERFEATLQMFDIVRLDHFRGFQAYWAVPATEKTAVNGEWIDAPGAALFKSVQEALGELPFVAENLGVITPAVEGLRRQFGFPGMAVLQFAFGTDSQGADFQPHNYERHLFAYTGTHDNDTAIGWWNSDGGDSTRSTEDVMREKEFAKKYLGTDGREINWVLIRTLHASVANVAIVPIQDVLGLGSESRMNKPGTAEKNWAWRMRPGAFTPEIRSRLRELTEMYSRIPKEPEPRS